MVVECAFHGEAAAAVAMNIPANTIAWCDMVGVEGRHVRVQYVLGVVQARKKSP